MSRPNGNSPNMANNSQGAPAPAAIPPLEANRNPFNLAGLFAALPSVATRKNKKNKRKVRKDPKARNYTTAKNKRAKEARNRRRANFQRRVAEKRVAAIEIRQVGVDGLRVLERKLRRLERFYDAANVGKQSDITVYVAFLTTEIQEVFANRLGDRYRADYPELHDGELAQDHPMEYIEELSEFLEEIIDQYDDEFNNNARQIQFDIDADEILAATNRAGRTFNNMSEERNNNALNGLANIFGAMGV